MLDLSTYDRLKILYRTFLWFAGRKTLAVESLKSAKGETVQRSLFSLLVVSILMLMSGLAVAILFYVGEQTFEIKIEDDDYAFAATGGLAAFIGIFFVLLHGYRTVMGLHFLALLLIGAATWISCFQAHDQLHQVQYAEVNEVERPEYGADLGQIAYKLQRKFGSFGSNEIYRINHKDYNHDNNTIQRLSKILASSWEKTDAEYACMMLAGIQSVDACNDRLMANPYDDGTYQTISYRHLLSSPGPMREHATVSSANNHGKWNRTSFRFRVSGTGDERGRIGLSATIVYSMIDDADGMFTLDPDSYQIAISQDVAIDRFDGEREVRLRVTVGGQTTRATIDHRIFMRTNALADVIGGRETGYLPSDLPGYYVGNQPHGNADGLFVLEDGGRIVLSEAATIPNQTTSYDLRLLIRPCESAHFQVTVCGDVTQAFVSSSFDDLDDRFWQAISSERRTSQTQLLANHIADISHRVILLIAQGRTFEALETVERFLNKIEGYDQKDRIFLADELNGYLHWYVSRNFPTSSPFG